MTDLEFVTVFGLLQFGAAASGWDDDLFYFRTGIALQLWKKGIGKNKIY
ncbi:MAG: hypothetical protein LIO93_08460 [Bacteroidales bacterium]|nr:hypothetical protein [Bacteroidales bacterium]